MCLMYETKTVKGTLRSRVRCWGKRFRSIWMSQSETSDESIQTYERSVRVCKLHVTVHRLLLSRPLTIAPQHKDNKRVCILKFAFIFPASCFTLVWSCYTKWPPRVPPPPPTQKHQPLMLNHDLLLLLQDAHERNLKPARDPDMHAHTHSEGHTLTTKSNGVTTASSCLQKSGDTVKKSASHGHRLASRCVFVFWKLLKRSIRTLRREPQDM